MGYENEEFDQWFLKARGVAIQSTMLAFASESATEEMRMAIESWNKDELDEISKNEKEDELDAISKNEKEELDEISKNKKEEEIEKIPTNDKKDQPMKNHRGLADPEENVCDRRPRVVKRM